MKAAEPKHITEDQYDKLSEEHKKAFNETVRHFKAERRAHAERAVEREKKWKSRDFAAEVEEFEMTRAKVEQIFADYAITDHVAIDDKDAGDHVSNGAKIGEKTWEAMSKQERVETVLKEAQEQILELLARVALMPGDEIIPVPVDPKAKPSKEAPPAPPPGSEEKTKAATGLRELQP